MKRYEYKATRMICDAFEEQGVTYYLHKRQNLIDTIEEIWVPIPITLGPLVHLRYIIRDDDNDTVLRIQGLLTKVPKEKRFRVLETCAAINGDYDGNNYLKFCMDDSGDINVGFDVPLETPDESVGSVACELYEQTAAILERQFPRIAAAFYSKVSDGLPVGGMPAPSSEDSALMQDEVLDDADLEALLGNQDDEDDENAADLTI